LPSTVAAGEFAGSREDVLHVLGESHLVLDLANLFLDILLGPGRPRGERSTVKALSAYLELRIAKSLCLALWTYDMPFPNAVIFPRLSIMTYVK
jgi:hypothetical protein